MKARFVFFFLICVQTLALSAKDRVSVKGLVRDKSEGTDIEWADVVVVDMKDKQIAHGEVSDGAFALSNISEGECVLMIRLMGYETYISSKLTLRADKETDMGVIRLVPLATGIQEVQVKGQKNSIAYRMDRQVIDANATAGASGGTAVDVLKASPSVTIDADGNVSFRGSDNFLVYVDGHLSHLEGTAALRQIPAATIDNVEIVTTPSTRERADSEVGVIRINTKHGRQGKTGGTVTATGGTLGTWSTDATVDFQRGRHNWYVGGTAQDIVGKSDFRQEKMTSVDKVRTNSFSDGKRWSRNKSYLGRAGWQYVNGIHHDLSLDVLCGETSNWRGGDMEYKEDRMHLTTAEEHSAVYDSHDRYNLKKKLFQTTLGYKWKLDKLRQFVFSNRFRYDWYSLEYTESNMFDMQGHRFEGTRGYEREHHWDCDASVAYERRYGANGLVELGYQYVTYSEHGSYHINYWDRDAWSFVWQDDLATPFYYRRQVHSPYLMWKDAVGGFSFDAGVRADRVIDELEIDVVGADRNIFRFDVFPSAHLSYVTKKGNTFFAGYSYRTVRPGIWTLEPYITYEDYYTKKKGNPDINPEYTHAVEAGWRKSLKEKHTLSATAYYRHRRDISDWVRKAYEPGVTLDSIVNAGTQVEAGLELNAMVRPVSWWNMQYGGNVAFYDFTSHSEVCTDRYGWSFQVLWNNSFQVAKNTHVQFDGHVVGPQVLTQGRERAYCYFDLSGRQDFLNKRLSLSLAIHDVFHTAKYYKTRFAEGLSSRTWVRPRYPNIMLSATYSFNTTRKKEPSVQSGSLFEGKDF